ncbi:MAG: prephenate dehydrogenase [Lentisphaeria bacterium]|nr:prephenate dehydrogenase [Lentisphaeria bacterium]
MKKTVTIIGLGLIGGSMAIDLRKRGFAGKLIGVDINPTHAAAAKTIGLIDAEMSLAEAMPQSDLIIVATPVNATIKLLPEVLDLVDRHVVTDVASTKGEIVAAVTNHPKRRRFVASHPMAGTENSGPWSALSGLYDGKAAIICDSRDSDDDAVDLVERMYAALYMRCLRMESHEHDVHVAYVSHISHVSSFALALTVLAKEKDKKNIFDLASGGFSSTVRLAKSGSAMWTPIFMKNRDNVLTVLDTYLTYLNQFREALQQGDEERLDDLIREANTIRRVLN